MRVRANTVVAILCLTFAVLYGYANDDIPRDLPLLAPVEEVEQRPVSDAAAVSVPSSTDSSTARMFRITATGVTSSADVVDGPSGDVVLNAPAPYGTSGVLLVPGASHPDAAVRLGSSAGTFTVFSASDLPLLSVRADGNVGIGTRTPSAALHLHRDHAGLTLLQITNPNAGSASGAAGTGIRLYEGSLLKSYVQSIGSGSTNTTGGAGALQIFNTQAAPIVFGTASVERLRVDGAGNVLIGTSSAPALLNARSQTGGSGTIHAQHSVTYAAPVTYSENVVAALAAPAPNSGVTYGGALTALRPAIFVNGAGSIEKAFGVNGAVQISPPHTGTITNAYGAYFSVRKNTGTIQTGYGLYIDDVDASKAYALYAPADTDTTYIAGRVGIGPGVSAPTEQLHVAGNLKVDGNITGVKVINAVFQDIAEWVPVTEAMPPGTVVTLNRARPNEVMPSGRPYDTSVAGVVSAEPGIVLGVAEADEPREKIATYGRVRVRVDATERPIRIGDLLVTSAKRGLAMRSEPLTISGHSFHQPGTIIGKALEPLDSGEGDILVLLSLQ